MISSHLPLGLMPTVVEGSPLYRGSRSSNVPVVNNRATWLENPRLTPFGQSLLDLLRSEGVRSSNEAIRTTSQQVVDALTQIAELEV